MDNTCTIRSGTRWDGRAAPKGTVFRIPEDVDIETARRWLTKGIAIVGGEWVSPSGTAGEPQAFGELEKDLDDEKEQQIETLSKRSKDDLLGMAKARLIELDSKATKEEIARILVETPEN